VMAVNHVTYQGRLTKDPELETTQSGINHITFRLAWNKKVKEIEKKCFLECTAWRQLAETISKYCTKGQEIIVEGELNTDEWDKDGQHYSKIVLAVDKFHFCGKKDPGTDDADKKDDFIRPVMTPTSSDDLPF